MSNWILNCLWVACYFMSDIIPVAFILRTYVLLVVIILQPGRDEAQEIIDTIRFVSLYSSDRKIT